MKQANTPAIVLVALLASFLASAAAAAPRPPTGAPPSGAPAPSTLSWLTDYRFHLTAASLRSDDPRFDWDAHFGGDLDLLDYGVGRINVLADYAVIIGSEFRPIDPNQGAYHLGVSASVRSGASEIHGIFDHVSRHLSDRPNHTAVAWNTAGVAATARYTGTKATATVSGYGGKVVQAAFVDYRWQFGVGVDAACPVSPAVSLIARGELAPTLVDRAIAGRGTQTAGRIEGGVRLRGKAAAVELFAAWERRLDPYPLERGIGSWAVVGFRLVNR